MASIPSGCKRAMGKTCEVSMAAGSCNMFIPFYTYSIIVVLQRNRCRETEGWLYAIQSLRNAITAQTFLASTVLSLLTLITGKVWDILRSASNKWERRLLIIQLLSISATMLFSANQFLQGVRLMTHVGFMFPVKNDSKVDNIMRKTESCQWLGIRSMHLSLAPIAWVVGGSRAFFATSLALIIFFRQLDKKPEGLGYEEFQASNI
jgi:hypothetical protein